MSHETVGKRVNAEPVHLENVPASLKQVDGFYLRLRLGEITASDGRKVNVSSTGFCFIVERGGRYILVDPTDAIKRAAQLILEQEDAQ